MTWVWQIVSILLGGVTGGLLFTYACRGDISWWLVVVTFVWFLSAGMADRGCRCR